VPFVGSVTHGGDASCRHQDEAPSERRQIETAPSLRPGLRPNQRATRGGGSR
jgi:hypothetical protein